MARDPASRGRRDHLLVLAILSVLTPALLLGSAVLAPEPDRTSRERLTGAGETVVYSADWHPAIEHGLGPIGPAPGTSLKRDAVR